jgi:hypothetical protein
MSKRVGEFTDSPEPPHFFNRSLNICFNGYEFFFKCFHDRNVKIIIVTTIFYNYE